MPNLGKPEKGPAVDMADGHAQRRLRPGGDQAAADAIEHARSPSWSSPAPDAGRAHRRRRGQAQGRRAVKVAEELQAKASEERAELAKAQRLKELRAFSWRRSCTRLPT